MSAPNVCLLTCDNSLSELIAREVLKKLKGVAVCTLKAIEDNLPEAVETLEGSTYVILLDSCSPGCAKETAEKLGVRYDEYVNLEEELGVKVPCYEKPSVEVVDDVGLAVIRLVEEIGEFQMEVNHQAEGAQAQGL